MPRTLPPSCSSSLHSPAEQRVLPSNPCLAHNSLRAFSMWGVECECEGPYWAVAQHNTCGTGKGGKEVWRKEWGRGFKKLDHSKLPSLPNYAKDILIQENESTPFVGVLVGFLGAWKHYSFLSTRCWCGSSTSASLPFCGELISH